MPELLMNEVSHIVKRQQGVIIAISPEGTRKKVERLKSGFLRIAKTTNSQILLAGIDFESKLQTALTCAVNCEILNASIVKCPEL